MTLDAVNKTIIDELSKDRPSDKDYKGYLRGIFKICRDTIGKLSSKSVVADLPDGCNISLLKKELLNSTNALLRAYNSYSAGKIITAINIMKKFLVTDAIKTYDLNQHQSWYRARNKNKSGSGFKAKEMFHIPFENRTDVVNYRFSITGYPCLYLGNTILSCWEEMHTPALDDFVVSRVKVNDEKIVRTLDLRIPYISPEAQLWDDRSDEMRRSDNLMLLKTWPLIIACSIKTITPNAQFKYEYIHPQLLMLAIKEQDTNVDGVTYTSTHVNSNMNDDVRNYTNVAIPVMQIKSKGLCKTLCETFSVTRGISFMEAEIKNVFTNQLTEVNGETLNIIDIHYGGAPYEKTKFGQLESFLTQNVETENLL